MAKILITGTSKGIGYDASVDDVFGKLGDSVDVLVNNAGIYSIDTVEDESFDRFKSVMETNYFGAVRCVKRVLPARAGTRGYATPLAPTPSPSSAGARP